MEYVWVKADEKNIEIKVNRYLKDGWEPLERPFKTKILKVGKAGTEIQFYAQALIRRPEELSNNKRNKK